MEPGALALLVRDAAFTLGFDLVGVDNHVDPFAKLHIVRLRHDADRAARQRQKSGRCAQQRRLSGAVWAGEQQRFTGGRGKRNAVHDDPAAAFNDQVFSDELHGDGHRGLY